MMHKTCSINYGHLADLQKTLPTTDLNKKQQLSFDKISPRDFRFFPFLFNLYLYIIYSGISYGSHYLVYYYHCCYFIKWYCLIETFLGFISAFMDSLSPHITTPVPLAKVCWSGNEVYTPLPLHPCHSIATLEWHCSVNLHICDALQWHFGGTLHCHSYATPKVHSNATPECTLHCHSVTTTPMPLSKYTPTPLRSTHSTATSSLPLQCHSQSTLQCHSGVSLEC